MIVRRWVSRELRRDVYWGMDDKWQQKKDITLARIFATEKTANGDQGSLPLFVAEAVYMTILEDTNALQEAIRARIRLYDSRIDPDCIGTGYDATDIITMAELEQLVGFGRAAPARKEGEG